MRYICHEFGEAEFTEFSLVDSTYVSNLNIEAVNSIPAASFNLDLPITHKSESENLTFQGDFLIGEQNFHLQLIRQAPGSFLLNAEKDSYQISSQGILSQSCKPNVLSLMGPALILHLALNEVFCFHSSAFYFRERLIVVFAESGSGKSTIARHMNESEPGSRVADDILAMGVSEGEIILHPKFPQLKLDSHSYMSYSSEKVRPVLLFMQGGASVTQFEPIDPISALKRLISHSVASRLFDPDTLNTHLQYCRKLLVQSESHLLSYAHSPDSLNTLKECLDELV